MKDKIGDRQRLIHIGEAISEIEVYLKDVDLVEFKNNSMMRFASIKQIEIIGEAARYISPETKDKYPAIEWKQIASLRNLLVHEYFGIDAELVWQIIKTDIPDLKEKLKQVIDT